MSHWRYRQIDGVLFRVHNDGTEALFAIGYSGKGEGLNNPAMQHVPNVGPIPCGWYDQGAPYTSKRVGPFAIPLEPDPANEMFGRSAFRIHGDNYHQNHSASEGCPILPRAIREDIHESGDRIQVVSGIVPAPSDDVTSGGRLPEAGTPETGR